MPIALGRRCRGGWSRHAPLARRSDEPGVRVSGENGVESRAPVLCVIGHERSRSISQLTRGGSTFETSSTSCSVRPNATISPLSASMPICDLRQERRFAVACFSNNHSLAPRSFSPASRAGRLIRRSPSARANALPIVHTTTAIVCPYTANPNNGNWHVPVWLRLVHFHGHRARSLALWPSPGG